MTPVSTSHFLPLGGGVSLHVKRFCTHADGKPVLMLHGSIENGRIFYTDNGKGFAPWLAQQGFDVFVPDLQGRGLSTPRVSRHSTHGLKELMELEFPAILEFIHAEKGLNPMHWVAHSWGGVDMLTYLARPSMPVQVEKMVFFGTKRRIGIRSLRYYWMVGVGWDRLSRYSIRRKGYLDAVHYKMGADNLSAQTFFDTDRWVHAKDWVHAEDGFDYAANLKQMDLPPVLYLAGKRDHVLGNPADVARLAAETGPESRYRVHVLGKGQGHLHDYGHIDMLTHKDAPRDVYPLALEWLSKEFPSGK
jgi:predicted alpha/beta hydrolase